MHQLICREIKKIFHKITQSNNPIIVRLPNGTLKKINMIGNFKISNEMYLKLCVMFLIFQ